MSEIDQEVEKAKDEISDKKLISAIAEIIQCTMEGDDGDAPEKEDVEDFIEKIRQGKLMEAFFSLPIIVWRTCENDDLREKYSELFIEVISGRDDAEEVIDLAKEVVHGEIFAREFYESQATAEYFLQCLKDMAHQALIKKLK